MSHGIQQFNSYVVSKNLDTPEYKDWFVGLSYDINTSTLVPASKARGGFEIAVRYIMYRFKPKRIEHRVCPDFI